MCADRLRFSPRSRTTLLASGLTVLVLLATACAEPEPHPYFDLVEHFPVATVESGDSTGEELSGPVATGSTGHLFLPVGSRVSFAFLAEPGSVLRAESVAIRGASTQISLSVETDTAEARLFTLSQSERECGQELGISHAEPAKLTLEVLAADPENGDGVLLSRPVVHGLVTEATSEVLAPELHGEQPNFLIYLVDTLRRDRLGVYGYGRPSSPELDQFAAEATLFSKSYAQSSWTKSSVTSLLTGFWPPKHGVTGWAHRLPDSFETLPEKLRQSGWTTAGFITNVNAGVSFNVAQGFDHLWYKKRERSHPLNEHVFEWLDSYDGERPFFMYVHTMDPHAGYNPAEPYRSALAPTADEMPTWEPRWNWPLANAPFLSDLYDGEIAQNDAAFGALLDRLRALGLYDDTLIVFISDHGEEFREHDGWRHGRRLYAESLDVPIVIKFPEQAQGQRSDLPVSHVDILPTVLDLAGLPPFDAADGQSLISPTDRPVFSHLRLGKAPLQYSVIVGSWKLIRTHRKEITLQLFDLSEDPREINDLGADLPVRTAAMAALIEERLLHGTTSDTVERALSEETERELRALGYLQ